MANLKIERCTVHGLGKGYKVVDADTDNNFWSIWYATTDKAIRDCGEHTVVSVCLSWEADDALGEDDFSIQYSRDGNY